MNRSAALASFVLFFSACGGDGARVAVEPNGDADIRIVLTVSSRGSKNAIALSRDEAFRLPIEDVANGNATLEVVVVAYDRARLDAAFPGLSKADLATLKSTLKPTFGAPAAGAYAPPAPLRALRTTVAGGGTSGVSYTETPFEALLADPQFAFVFQLPAERACAPGAGELRAFSREAPEESCTFERDETCTWTAETPCPFLDTVFGRDVGAAPVFRELPGSLSIEPLGLGCPRVTTGLKLGETTTFQCPGQSGLVSVQETPRRDDGALWAFEPQPQLVTLRRARPVATRARKEGAVVAYQNGTNADLDLLDISDSGAGAANRVQLPGGLRLEIALGAGVTLLGLSANPISPYVALDAGSKAFVLESRPDLNGGTLANTFYANILPDGVPAPAQARGPLTVGSGSVLYWPTTSGLALYDGANPASPVTSTPAGTVALPGSSPASLLFDRDTERVTLWLSTGEVFLFDGQGGVRLSGCDLEGRVLAALPGRRVVTSRRPFVLEIYELASFDGQSSCPGIAPTQEIFIPPITGALDGTLELDGTSFLVVSGREMLAFRYGNFGGVLDLASGISKISPLSAAASSAVLLGGLANDEAWAIFPPNVGMTVQVFAAPAGAPLLGR